MSEPTAIDDITDFNDLSANGWYDMSGRGKIIADNPYYSVELSRADSSQGPCAMATIDKQYALAFKQSKVLVKFRIRISKNTTVKHVRLYAMKGGAGAADFPIPPADNNWHEMESEWMPSNDTTTAIAIDVNCALEDAGRSVDFDDIHIIQS